MKTESQLQAEIIKFLKKDLGGYVIKCQAGPSVPTGCPDLIALINTEWVAIEVKRDAKSEFQPLQEVTLKKMKDMNPYVYVAHWGNWTSVRKQLKTYFDL